MRARNTKGNAPLSAQAEDRRGTTDRLRFPGRTAVYTMELLGALSNPDVQERLELLSDKLDRLASSDAKHRRSSRKDQKLRPGVVLDAVISVLSSAEQPLRPAEVQELVAVLLGRSVAYSAVKACLADKSTGADAPFERVRRGHYRLLEGRPVPGQSTPATTDAGPKAGPRPPIGR